MHGVALLIEGAVLGAAMTVSVYELVKTVRRKLR